MSDTAGTGTFNAPGPGAASAGGRVFISHASPDAIVATRLCTALEAALVPCWIAPRDVHAGESYAAAIVQAINSCRALVLLVSQNSVGSVHVLREVERASSKSRPVLSIRLDAAVLPPDLEYFLSVNHWLDASGGDIEAILPALIQAVGPAASPGAGAPPAPPPSAASTPTATPPAGAAAAERRAPPPWAIAIAVIAMVFGLYRSTLYWNGRHDSAAPAASATPAPVAGAAAGFTPPPHSVAVLPFLNMSGDKEQEYFSDGLSEELLNSLATIRDLQVAARTSSFSFKGSQADTAEIAHKLNVGALLEGSVRKAGNQVRITAQLINAVTGFQIWSKTYDRDLKNALTVQADVAREVTSALQGTLMAGESATIELGGTDNPQAYDAYLRGERVRHGPISLDNDNAMLMAYGEAIRLDPKFAKAYLGRAGAELDKSNYVDAGEIRAAMQAARATVEVALKLAPGLAEAHQLLGRVYFWQYEFAKAVAECDRAYELAPGNAEILRAQATRYTILGQFEKGVGLARRAVELDPLNLRSHLALGSTLTDGRRYEEGIHEFDRGLSLTPDDAGLRMLRGLNEYLLGRYEAARADCEAPKLDWGNRTCLAMVYYKLKRPAEARAQLEALQKEFGDTASYQQAQIHAQWGETDAALAALETGYRVQDPGLGNLKIDELLDPLRKEPRFIALMKKMNFPD
jgi:TolB-like protein/tetratricopeptide (TPR) repeat protein